MPGPRSRYMERGEGAYLVDLDGRRFLDLNANFTTLIHGHRFAPVIDRASCGPALALRTPRWLRLASRS
ncbi:glutamate-1-semialdehyde aminotransferase [Bradyrhizobium sp. I1.7.5]